MSESYPSSEDTYLLLDVLKHDEELIDEKLGDCGIAVEIGYVKKCLNQSSKSSRNVNFGILFFCPGP